MHRGRGSKNELFHGTISKERGKTWDAMAGMEIEIVIREKETVMEAEEKKSCVGWIIIRYTVRFTSGTDIRFAKKAMTFSVQNSYPAKSCSRRLSSLCSRLRRKDFLQDFSVCNGQ